MMKKVFFVSDVHLGFFPRKRDRIRETMLVRCLQSIKDECGRLVIVGDFFDYWFDWGEVIPKYFYRTLAVLADFRESGIEIDYLMGNHDFGHRNFFAEELDITIYPDSIEREFFGKKFFIYHGDGLAYHDKPYLLLKKVLRNKTNLKLYTCLIHPDCALRMASNFSVSSRQTTSNPTRYGPKDGMLDFAISKLQSGFDYVIMGHRHVLSENRFDDGVYINLGDWFSTPGFGVFDESGFRFVSAENILNRYEEKK